jgi:IS30 family transposase
VPGKILRDAERARVIRLAAKGCSVHEIAEALGRWDGTIKAVLRGKPLRPGYISDAESAQMAAWAAQGMTSNEIGARTGRSPGVVRAVLSRGRARSARHWCPCPARLSLAEREELRVGLSQGLSLRALGARLGRAPSTLSREVSKNGGRDPYRAWAAHGRAAEAARRPKVPKLCASERLSSYVGDKLERLWSPQQISRRLAEEFPGDAEMQVSHETIYQSIFVQARGALRKELAACLRTGRAARRPKARLERPGKLKDMVMISERPAEAQDRAVPGHWEGDLIIGANNASAVGTLVERSTRYVLLMHLEDSRAETVDTAMRRAIKTLPAEMFRTITWDQGHEMARHAAFSIDTGIGVYFCDPHSPWQRGSNENTNGLLRQYMPKSTDLSVYSQQDLDRFARSLNGRPRQTLGWRKPEEKMAELLPTVAVAG